MRNINSFYYICSTKKYLDLGSIATNYHKIATNQSLNQKSRCFYIGALCFYISNVLLKDINKQDQVLAGISFDSGKIV
jgi:hypothetical protein